ncbi:MAG: membrane protein insertase YidC [candidate division Zixibacteria bacterium]|nr:membrane protein insertase YidC [candidate division Zixibacteria bacterium]MCI0595943.1 membrane protein insertase YidC [candidate division Zixibacteria bacterium]
MDKRTVIGLVLIALVFILWPVYVQWINPKKPAPAKPVATGPVDTPKGAVPAEAPALIQSPAPQKQAALVSVPAETVTVETPLATYKLTTRGATFVSVILKKYYLDGKVPLELLPSQAGASFEISLPHHNFYTSTVDFKPDSKKLELSNDQKAVLTFKGQTEGGRKVQVSYDFSAQSYALEASVLVDSLGDWGRDYRLGWKGGLLVTEKRRQDALNYFGAYARMGTEVVHQKSFKNDSLREAALGETFWIASRSKYFAAVIIPKEAPGTGFWAEGLQEYDSAGLSGKKISVFIGATSRQATAIAGRFTLFVGPLDYNLLRSFDNGLEKLLDLGAAPLTPDVLVEPIAVGMLWLFKSFYKFFPNYGVVIIVFSILIKLLTLPLSRKSAKSMARMAEIQPRLEKLKEKYKKDPKKLNEETLKLYREIGFNPFAGCLPLLLQFPLFMALYAVLSTSIELRQAPFVFWISDLSAADQLFIMPVLMTVLMFWQQKLTIRDPKQKMMVYLLPAIFFFFFFQMPSGLVLYWTLFNLFSVLEQYWVKKQLAPPAPATPAPVAQ